jgi:hypothetical protein
MQLNRMSKIAIGVAAACALYSAGGFWGVPALMKWAAEGPATEALGRKVSIEKAEFNPWTLEATVHNIAMADQAGANPALSIGRVYVNTAFLESIKRFGVVLQELSVDAFNGSILINEKGGTSFDDVIARLSAPDAEKPQPQTAEKKDAEKKEKPFPFCINNIELANSGFHISAPSMGVNEKITDLELAVPFIGTIGADVERHVTPKLSFKDNGAPFAAEGQTLPFQDSIATKLHADIKGYSFAHLAGLAPASAGLKINSGTLSLSADLIFALATQEKPATILLKAKASSDGVDVHMKGAQAESSKFTFAKLAVDLDELDLIKQSATLGSVKLSSPAVSLPDNGVSSKASELAIGGIHLAWKDKGALTLTNESLKLLGASAKLAGDLPLEASVGSLSVSKGRVAVKDTISVALKSADVGNASVSLPVNAATVTVLTDKANASGIEWADGASGYTRLASSLAEKIAFEIAGQKSQFGAIDSVSVSKLNAPAQGTISLESVKIEKPRYRVSKLADGTLDIDPLLGKRESAEKAQQVREQVQAKVQKVEQKTGRDTERPIRVGEIAVNNGFLGFTDRSVNPPGEIRCGDVKVSIKPLAIGGEDTPATVQTSALINGVSKIKLTGQGSPLADKGKLTAKGSLTSVSMPFFSPYTLHYTSYPIKRGNLTVNADVTITDKSKLKVDNHITIERLEWGDYSPNATSSALPVTLASALLTDSKGNVDFGLPISGDLADPTFSIGEVVLIALKNLILKVVASPVNLLTSLATFGLGNGATNSVMIPYVAGLAQMGEEQKQIARPIVEALKKNPKSKLEIIPVVALKGEDLEVHRRTYEGMLKIAMSTLPAGQRTRDAAVSKVFKMILPKENQSLSTQQKEQKLYGAVKPDLNSVVNMANARAKIFSRMLVENGIDESRIFIAHHEVDEKGTSGGIKIAILK